MYFGCFKSTGPDFCLLQPWQCSCHNMAQQWQPPWGSRQCPLGVFRPPWTSRGTGEPPALTIGHRFQMLQEGGACDPTRVAHEQRLQGGRDIALFSIPSDFVPSPGCWKQKLSFPQFVPSNFHHFQHVDFTVNFIASSAMLFSSYPLNSLSFTS